MCIGDCYEYWCYGEYSGNEDYVEQNAWMSVESKIFQYVNDTVHIAQTADGNTALLYQSDAGSNDVTIEQLSNNNYVEVVQNGDGNTAIVTQDSE